MRRNRFAQGQHDWIGLLDISGPFLSPSSLQKAFPMGLDAIPGGQRQEFQLAFEEWYASDDKRIHETWINWVLNQILEYDEEVLVSQENFPADLLYRDEATQEVVRPSLLVISADDEPKPLMPILIVPKEQKLGNPLAGARWVASPNQRLQALLRTNKLTCGLVTNGSEWAIVHVREGDATGYITLRADVIADEEDLLRAFASCLGLRRVVGAAEGESLAELLLASRDDEEQLTLDLGKQVRQSVELLVREMDRLDETSGRELLKDESDEILYRGCLTVLMRLMFLLCAEERKLLPVEESEAYSDCYAASTLLSQLEAEASEHGEEILERRYDAWVRLLATARLVHGGSPIPELQMTAYGGSLFDPSLYPFLEKLKVNNRVTLHILESLQYILVDGVAGKERRRVSFEALDVEQIGYVYEGLLDHTISTASEPVLGMVGIVTYEPELRISKLEAGRAKGETFLLKLLKDEKVGKEKATEKQLKRPVEKLVEASLRAACGGDQALLDRVLPWANLIRTDTIGRYQVYLPDSRYVTNSDERRGTGTHYTPRFLAEEMVEHTLAPLIVEGMAEGLPQEDWRKKSATELLNLRIADIAMGSGAFLVAVCRFLSAKVVEAWNDAEREVGERLVCTDAGELQLAFDPQHEDRKPGQKIETKIGSLTVAAPKHNEPIPLDETERLAVARSMVVDRCLYGVDINPMATEMAKLSLWLITMRRDRPFHFLDHALKCGDSLVGVTLKELKAFSLNPKKLLGGSVLLPWIPESVARVENLRKAIRETPSNTVMGVQAREALHARAEEDEAALRVAADLLLTEAFERVDPSAKQARLAKLQSRPDKVQSMGLASVMGRPSFHYELEFADIFVDGGFDAVVGNPPFVGGQKITGSMGVPFRDYIVARIAGGQKGSADLCAYFFLRACGLLNAGGSLGLLATNTISEGDTREVGLDRLLKPLKEGVAPLTSAYRAVKTIKWPSKSANLEVAKVWLRKGEWTGTRVLEGNPVEAISPMLDSEEGDRKPKTLAENLGLSYIGSYVLGMGFVLEPEQAESMLTEDPDLDVVLFPYLNGEDLNSRPDQSPSRWVINFHDWPLGRVGQTLPVGGEDVVEVARKANSQKADDWFPTKSQKWDNSERSIEKTEELQRHWLQMGVVPSDYTRPVAADFPKALEVVERHVRPERQRPSKKGPDKDGRDFELRKPLAERFWHYGEKRPELYSRIGPLRRCLCRALVSQYHNFAWVPTKIVMSHATGAIASERDAIFAAVQSIWHQVWTEMNASTLETRQRYTPSDCFETFPLPDLTAEMDATGEALDDARRAAMQARSIGLTDVAKLMHKPSCRDADIESLRQAVIANDAAVTAAYGWEVDLEHDFYDMGRGPRFTVSPAARTQMLRLLLAENHRRYAAEQESGPRVVRESVSQYDSTPVKGGLFGNGDLTDGEDDR